MSFRRKLQARLPGREKVAEHRLLRWLGHRLHDPNLWHFGRRAVSRGAGVGVLVAFFPIPIHMLLVAPIAIALGLNLPVVIAVVWITNPFTWVPIFYFAYRVGVLATGGATLPLAALNLGPDFGSLQAVLGQIWLPLFAGSAICGLAFGFLTYAIVESLWRLSVARRWRRRGSGRQASTLP